MPNWCENSLYIRGPKAEIQRFLDAVKTKDSGLDFNTIAPYPDELRTGETVEEAYEWCQRNWGTRCIDDTWTPPIPVILEASKRFRELEFDLEYSDPAVALGGIYRAKNGFDAHADCGSLVVWNFNVRGIPRNLETSCPARGNV